MPHPNARFFDGYYQNPEPGRVVEVLRWLVDERFVRGTPASTSLSSFGDGDAKFLPALGLLFRRHDALARDVLNTFRHDVEAVQRTFWLAAHMGGVSIDAVREHVDEKKISNESKRFLVMLGALDPVPVEALPITGPVVLDMLWGAFFVTGDATYIRRIIIEALALITEENDPLAQATAGSALWSLKANAHAHPVIVETCRALLPEVNGEGWQMMLTSIIESADTPPEETGHGFGIAPRPPEESFDGSLGSIAAACWLLVTLGVALIAPVFIIFGVLSLFPFDIFVESPTTAIVLAIVATLSGFAGCAYLFTHQHVALKPWHWLVRTVRAR